MDGFFVRRLSFRRALRGLEKSKAVVGNVDLVFVRQAAGLAHPAAIEVGAVGAAQIDQPEFLLALRMDHGVAARNAITWQGQRAAASRSEHASATNDRLLSAGRFQPGGDW